MPEHWLGSELNDDRVGTVGAGAVHTRMSLSRGAVATTFSSIKYSSSICLACVAALPSGIMLPKLLLAGGGKEEAPVCEVKQGRMGMIGG